jgi:hypothetical protein
MKLERPGDQKVGRGTDDPKDQNEQEKIWLEENHS